jgi:hypothetical protein
VGEAGTVCELIFLEGIGDLIWRSFGGGGGGGGDATGRRWESSEEDTKWGSC